MMPANLEVLFASLPRQAQRQDATNAQLHDMLVFAMRLGLMKAVAVLSPFVKDMKVERVVASDVLESIAGQPTAGGDTLHQLIWLSVFANRLGLYDATDFVRVLQERRQDLLAAAC